jgi:hypothetical protein
MRRIMTSACLVETTTHGAPVPQEVSMFLALFVVFVLCWIFGWLVFHIAGGLIHALLVVAVISLVWHFMRPRAA